MDFHSYVKFPEGSSKQNFSKQVVHFLTPCGTHLRSSRNHSTLFNTFGPTQLPPSYGERNTILIMPSERSAWVTTNLN